MIDKAALVAHIRAKAEHPNLLIHAVLAGLATADRARRLRQGRKRLMAFQARYESRCADCGEAIHMGDLIEHDSEASVDDFRVTRYVHVECDPDDPTGLKAGEVVCTECWLVKPCGCEVD